VRIGLSFFSKFIRIKVKTLFCAKITLHPTLIPRIHTSSDN
jgi:hypothetical protein